jgi:hypothetical protein
LIILIALAVLLIAGTGGAFVYGYVNGFGELPLIGQFFQPEEPDRVLTGGRTGSGSSNDPNDDSPSPAADSATEEPTDEPTLATGEVPTDEPTTDEPTLATTETPAADLIEIPFAVLTDTPVAEPTETPTAAPIVISTEALTAAPTEAPPPAPTPEPTPIPTAPPVSFVPGSDYILHNSNTAYITDADLTGLTKEELRLARNEIYARYGRQFIDEALQDYFNSKSWYANITKLPKGTEPTLSEVELRNIEKIQEHEAR